MFISNEQLFTLFSIPEATYAEPSEYRQALKAYSDGLTQWLALVTDVELKAQLLRIYGTFANGGFFGRADQWEEWRQLESAEYSDRQVNLTTPVIRLPKMSPSTSKLPLTSTLVEKLENYCEGLDSDNIIDVCTSELNANFKKLCIKRAL